eukprot:gene12753-17099_t
MLCKVVIHRYKQVQQFNNSFTFHKKVSLSFSSINTRLPKEKDVPEVESIFPKQARTVIIGGGIIGSSVAYHLSKLNRKEILVLEQGRIGCGTTWHAAGLVGQLRNTASEIYLSCYGSQLYENLEKETGIATGFKKCGSLTLAQCDDRIIALKRSAARAKAFNIEAHLISPKEANDMLDGLIETKDLKGALWLPGDGTVNPTDLASSYIAGAKKNGVKVFEGVKVSEFHVDEQKNQVTRISTNFGDIECDEVVNCAGQWARNVGLMAGVNVPLHSAEHYYVVTEPRKPVSISTNLPLFRDPDSYTYFREWSGGLIAGGFEPVCKPCFPSSKNQRNQIPDNFEFQLFPEDWDHFSILMEGSLKRIPSLETMGIQSMVNGPESFTADNQYILGEAPERKKYFVAAGFNSSGIASSGGAGKALAEWIVSGSSPLDLWPCDIRRFTQLQNNGKYLHDRTLETLGLHYQINYPKRELESSRPFRKSPIYDLLLNKGAVFGSKFGWERPNYFNDNNKVLTNKLTYNRPEWFERVKLEHESCRNNVVLFDQTSFSKILIQGKDSFSFLQKMCCNTILTVNDTIVYTSMLNEKGGIEADVTITKLNHNEFMLITSTAQATRDMDWIKRHISDEQHVTVTDVTSAYAIFSLMGPHSRQLLSELTSYQLTNEQFPMHTSKLIDLGYATVRANRISYVGELGYELIIPMELASYCYNILFQNGVKYKLLDGGYYAIDSLRLEKGYRAWGAELSSDWNPFECGLGFILNKKLKDNNSDFVGKKALLELKTKKLEKYLVTFTLDDESVFPWGSESILQGDRTIGYVTSAAYGFTINRGVIIAMIKNISNEELFDENKSYFIDVNGKLIKLTPSKTSAVYDPKSLKMK